MPRKTAGVYEMGSMALNGTWQELVLEKANLYIFQCRDDTNNINVSHNRSGVGYFTIKVRQSLPLSSFFIDTVSDTSSTETLYFRGTAGSTLEWLKQKQT